MTAPSNIPPVNTRVLAALLGAALFLGIAKLINLSEIFGSWTRIAANISLAFATIILIGAVGYWIIGSFRRNR